MKWQTLMASGAGVLMMTQAMPAAAQELDSQTTEKTVPIENIVVYGENVYRNRVDTINPALSYDLQFFQRFEPTTVGEMLKRTPGIVFTSDVLEYDAVQMRGLGSQYTKILINGRPVPGQSANGSFFVDRIPAELIDRIEIVRAPSVDVTGEGVAGALNIILKSGEDLDGAFVRLGGSYFPDSDVGNADDMKYSGSAAVAGAGAGYSYWVGADVQQRQNPKDKITEYFDADRVFDEEYELEADVRDGTDTTLNAGGQFAVGGGKLSLSGYWIDTDRDENEYVRIFEGPRDSADLVTIETQLENISQTSYGVDSAYSTPLGNGELELSFALNVFEEDTEEFETEIDVESAETEADDSALNIEDQQLQLGGRYKFSPGRGVTSKLGIDSRFGSRDGLQMGDAADVEADIETTRIALFTSTEFALSPSLLMEAGLRYESWDRDVEFEGNTTSKDGGALLPALHLRWDLTSADRMRASFTRTVRYPDLDLVTPFEEDEEPGDNDLLTGNPDLDPETAWGADLGYERRLGDRGIVGVNVFYRDISDLIEIVAIGAFGDGSEYRPLNVGDGETWGIEFDLSTPLDFIGLDETAFYGNLAFLDSAVDDPNTGLERQFTNQPDYVYNVSLVQNFPGLDLSAGVSYQDRDESTEFAFDEIVTTSYDGNLEIFVEKRFGERVVLRLTGTNLLDAQKLEDIKAYDGDSAAEFAAAIRNNDVDSYEVQREESSPVFSLSVRAAF